MVIDFDVYPYMIQELFSADPGLEHAVKDVFGLLFPAQPLSIFLSEMDAACVEKSVIFPIDCTTAHGCRIVTNEAVAELCEKYPRLIGFASVDPASDDAVTELKKAVKEFGLKGLKLDPALQNFKMSSVKAVKVYKEAASLGIPVLVDCGLNWAPKARLKDGNPLELEDAIIICPDTKFIIAHLAWPWYNEASALAMKYPNVYLDTSVVYSGTPTECLNHVINGMMGRELFERNLADKVVYGSSYPRTDMRRSMRGIKKVGFSDYFLKKLLYQNAEKLLNL